MRRATVADCVRVLDRWEDWTLVDYQPGNGECYRVGLYWLTVKASRTLGAEDGSILASFIDPPPGIRRATMLLAPAGYLSERYVAERLDIRDAAEAGVIADLLRYVLGRPGTLDPDEGERPACLPCKGAGSTPADALSLLREAVHFLPNAGHAAACAVHLPGTDEDGPTDCDCGVGLEARIRDLLRRADGRGDVG